MTATAILASQTDPLSIVLVSYFFLLNASEHFSPNRQLQGRTKSIFPDVLALKNAGPTNQPGSPSSVPANNPTGEN